MYADVAYLKGEDIEFEEKETPLVIASCGHYRMHKFDRSSTYRPVGRLDYQLLYIASGKAYFYFTEDRKTLITAGQMVLYRPKELQKYQYHMEEQADDTQTEVFWVHFTGSQVAQLLNLYGFQNSCALPGQGHILHCTTSPEYARILKTMIKELQLQKPYFQDNLSLLFQQLLIAVTRQTSAPEKAHTSARLEIEKATEFFLEHYNKDIQINEIAASQNMSISWFIRCFKQYHGKTPLEYILGVRISTAKHLLRTTTYNISEIAAIVGYDNQLYFSRLFKKQTGVSPSAYRRLQCPFKV